MGSCCGSDAARDSGYQPIARDDNAVDGLAGQCSASEDSSSEAPPVSLLCMHLDENRDGIVDGAPAACANWTWGRPGAGGIIMVPWATPTVGAPVPERLELRFQWDAGRAETRPWQATLAIDEPARVRVYASRNAGAPALDLGQPLVLDRQPLSADAATSSLWIEAVAPGGGVAEASWRVMLTFAYQGPDGAAPQQQSQLRIAPWLMSSDLDATATVLGFNEANPGFSARLAHFVTGANVAYTARPAVTKPFMRDNFKCGWNAAPHYQQVIIQDRLDSQGFSQSAVPGTAAVRFPLAAGEPTAQDNGGNLLVTPPLPRYPFGRIVVGDVEDLRCRSLPFYQDQLMQAPIALDPTWLSVGHVDEVMSFLPDPNVAFGWPWRVLFLSARLGFILAYAASGGARRPHAGLPHLYARADAVNLASRLANDNWLQLRDRCTREFGVLQSFGGDGAGGTEWGPVAGPGQYEADPAAPPGQDGKVVLWNEATGHYKVQSIDAYLARRVEGNLFHSQILDMVQPRIDADREVLCQALQASGVPADEIRILEVPALFIVSDSVSTETADAVNMLVLRNAAQALRCLVPKPFGPVCHGEYLFQGYLQRRLANDMGLAVTFVNDWQFLHAHHGEVHCGTNQVPAPLPPGRAWWHQAPG